MRLEKLIAEQDTLLRHARQDRWRVGDGRFRHSHAPLGRSRFLWQAGTPVDLRVPDNPAAIPVRADVFTAYDTLGTRRAEDAILFKRREGLWHFAVASILPYDAALGEFLLRFHFKDLPQTYDIDLPAERHSFGRAARLAIVTDFDAPEHGDTRPISNPVFSYAYIHAATALYDADLPRTAFHKLPPGLRTIMRYLRVDRPGRAVREVLHAHAHIHGAALRQEDVVAAYTTADDQVVPTTDGTPLAFVNAPYRVATDAFNAAQGLKHFYGARHTHGFSRQVAAQFCDCVSREANAERAVRNNPGKYYRRKEIAARDCTQTYKHFHGRRIA